LYGSITTAGTRPAAPIAGAWATINYLGADGYLEKAAQVRDATRRFMAAIDEAPGLSVTGEPDMSVFEFGALPGRGIDIGGVGDVMDDRGWNLDRQQGGLHMMVSPYHVHVADRFADDLAAAVADHRESVGKAASYGGIAPA
jgi:glutamate/tyrosine decarboxylase-like PLP-dependent enzyme